jgi:phosphatidylglycerophosphate synthase
VAFSGRWPVKITGLLFIFPVVLDGLDGFLARRMNQQSKFGALFDLETDSLFVALAGFLLYSLHIAGAWLLPAVYIRYIYVLLLTVLQLNGIPEKRTRFGPAVAVFMFISLLTAFVFPSVVARVLLILATGLVILSFGYSFIGVLSQRHND